VLASTGELNPAVKATIEKVFDFIPASTTPAELNSSFLSSHSTSAPHILACAEAAIDLQPTASAEQVELILSSLTQSNVTASVEQLMSASDVLERAGATKDQVDGYKAKCRSKLPLAWVFASDEEKASRKLEQGVDGVAVDGEKTDV
jgi:peptide alpha-N-acetyltransferase